MKSIKINGNLSFSLMLFFIILLASCKKDNSIENASATTAAVAAAQAVSVGLSTSLNDSVYVIGTCAREHHLDSIALASLPAAITDYLTTNYTGYTFQKAFMDKDSSGNITGYAVIIQFNGKPVGLKFDAAGNFIKVLEQREGHDLSGKGWHDGGCFSDRDGMHRDTVALAALPATVLSYFTTNYATDTLIRAYKNRDSSYIVFSKNNGAFATLFDANGTFIKRVVLRDHDHANKVLAISQSALPATIQSYLASTYPDYVFKQAFSFAENGILSGYVVCIDANGTKYAVEFDASGNFVKAVTIR